MLVHGTGTWKHSRVAHPPRGCFHVGPKTIGSFALHGALLNYLELNSSGERVY